MSDSRDNPVFSSTSASFSATPLVQKKSTVEEWVMAEMLNSECYFASDSFDVHTDVGGYVDLEGNLAENDWVVSVPVLDDRVCDVYPPDPIPMYQIIFREMGFGVPFTDFQVSIFNHLELAPNQLHPNSIAFLQAFELMCQHLDIRASVSLFFYCFTVKRKTKHGRWGWVSLKQSKKHFKPFSDSLKYFKTHYFLLRP